MFLVVFICTGYIGAVLLLFTQYIKVVLYLLNSVKVVSL